MKLHEMEEYDEVIRKLFRGLTPKLKQMLLEEMSAEERLAGLSPEERLAGLPPEQVVLGLPNAVLRGLSDETLSTFSEATQAAIRRRLGR